MSARRLFELLFILSLFTMAIRNTLDPDMWWHLRTGQLILEEGIPKQDPFSFTMNGQPWIAHEWLSEVVMWIVHQPLGLTGLILFFAAIIALAYFLVYLRSDGRPYLAAFVVLLAALAGAPLWGVRPQMFNILGAALLVYLLEGFIDQKISSRALWAIPIIIMIWANLHSGYLLGIAILGAYIIGQTVQLLFSSSSFRGMSWPDVGRLTIITVVAFLVAALNPNGPAIWIYPFFTLGSGAMQQYIGEWQSPDFHLTIFWPFAAMFFLGVIGLLASRRRPAFTDVLLFLGTAMAGFMSARHIPIFSVVAAPVVVRYMAVMLDGTRFSAVIASQDKQQPTPINLKIVNWLILLLAIVGAGIWTINVIINNEVVIAEHYPQAAVDYLEESDLASEGGYNSYNWGGYLIWRGIPVFIDGRADVYGDDFIHFYRLTHDVTREWREPLDRYEVAYILTERGSPLSTLLSASQEWHVSYTDDLATIYARATD